MTSQSRLAGIHGSEMLRKAYRGCCRYFDISRKESDDTDSEILIYRNGKHYKKDSREWLHKKSKKKVVRTEGSKQVPDNVTRPATSKQPSNSESSMFSSDEEYFDIEHFWEEKSLPKCSVTNSLERQVGPRESETFTNIKETQSCMDYTEQSGWADGGQYVQRRVRIGKTNMLGLRDAASDPTVPQINPEECLSQSGIFISKVRRKNCKEYICEEKRMSDGLKDGKRVIGDRSLGKSGVTGCKRVYSTSSEKLDNVNNWRENASSSSANDSQEAWPVSVNHSPPKRIRFDGTLVCYHEHCLSSSPSVSWDGSSGGSAYMGATEVSQDVENLSVDEN